MIDHRPCGVCRSLVPVAIGCVHWRGMARAAGSGASERAAAARREAGRLRQLARRQRQREELEAFRRAMGVR